MVFIDSNCRLEVPQHDISTKKDARRFQVAAATHRRTEFPWETEDGDARCYKGTSARPTGAVRQSLTGGRPLTFYCYVFPEIVGNSNESELN